MVRGLPYRGRARKGGRTVTFRQHQEVAVVEHDDSTRQPREGGKVISATVTAVDCNAVLVRYGDRGVPDAFWLSGWRVETRGEFRWRLVHVCCCDKPITGTPVTDQSGHPFCTEDCRDDDAGAWAGQHYGAGVAT